MMVRREMAEWRASSAIRRPKAEGLGSKFRKPRTSDFEPSPFPPVSLFSPFTLVPPFPPRPLTQNPEPRTQNFFARLAHPAFLACLALHPPLSYESPRLRGYLFVGIVVFPAFPYRGGWPLIEGGVCSPRQYGRTYRLPRLPKIQSREDCGVSSE